MLHQRPATTANRTLQPALPKSTYAHNRMDMHELKAFTRATLTSLTLSILFFILVVALSTLMN